MTFIFSIPKRIFDFIKSVFTELKFVDWLSRKELFNYTISVIFIIIVFGIILALVDQLMKFSISNLLSYFE